MNNAGEMGMVDIIRDVFGSHIDRQTVNVLVHLLYAYDICIKTDMFEEGYMVLEHSQRHASRVLAEALGKSSYMDVMGDYHDDLGANFEYLPDSYNEIIEITKKKLLEHPHIVEMKYDDE